MTDLTPDALTARQALREREAPTELLRRYFAAGGLQVVGVLLLVVGAVALLIGWWRISDEAIVAKQVPYLISGGLGGAFAIGVGALLLVVHELRLDNRRLAAIEEMVEELRDALMLDPGGVPVPPRRAVTAAAAGGGGGGGTSRVMVAGGTRYHDVDCPIVDGKDVETVTARMVSARSLEPCKLCAPA